MCLRLSEVIKEVTLSKSTIYRLIKIGFFPAPIKLSPGRVAWRKSEVKDFVASALAACQQEQGGGQ